MSSLWAQSDPHKKNCIALHQSCPSVRLLVFYFIFPQPHAPMFVYFFSIYFLPRFILPCNSDTVEIADSLESGNLSKEWQL